MLGISCVPRMHGSSAAGICESSMGALCATGNAVVDGISASTFARVHPNAAASERIEIQAGLLLEAFAECLSGNAAKASVPLHASPLQLCTMQLTARLCLRKGLQMRQLPQAPFHWAPAVAVDAGTLPRWRRDCRRPPSGACSGAWRRACSNTAPQRPAERRLCSQHQDDRTRAFTCPAQMSTHKLADTSLPVAAGFNKTVLAAQIFSKAFR